MEPEGCPIAYDKSFAQSQEAVFSGWQTTGAAHLCCHRVKGGGGEARAGWPRGICKQKGRVVQELIRCVFAFFLVELSRSRVKEVEVVLNIANRKVFA